MRNFYNVILLIIFLAGCSFSKNQKPLNAENVLILKEGKEISKEEMEAMRPEDIQSIDIFKNKKQIKKYTSGRYKGVILIHPKKKN